MNLEKLTKDELLKEFTNASDNYFHMLGSEKIYLLFGTPRYRSVKRRLQVAADELVRRKKR